MNIAGKFFGIFLLVHLLIPSKCVADPNIVEEPNSIIPATVAQWSKPSFSIAIENLEAEDIRLDPNTKLRFGMGTGHAYTNWTWNAIDENLCWVNLTEEVVIPSGATGMLVFEEALVCGELPADVYHPQLVLEGTYVDSGVPFTLTLETLDNPITVIYYYRQWTNSCGGGPATNEDLLFTPNGGFCHFSYPSSKYLNLITWTTSTHDNIPTMFEWEIGSPPVEDYYVDLRVLSPDCSIISQESGPPQKFTILVDNYDYSKTCQVQIAAYKNELTILGHKYSDYYYVRAKHIRCPHESGIIVHPRVGLKMEIAFDDELSCDISGITITDPNVYQTEVFDVNVSVTNPEQYKIVLSRYLSETYLSFFYEGNDVSNSFIVIPPYSSEWTDNYPSITDVIDGNQTKAYTYKVIPKGGGHICDDIDWVYIGDASNPNDVTGYGSVPYSYYIGKYEVTNAQYCHFLNSVDPKGENPYQLYDYTMGRDVHGGILLNVTAPLGSKYKVKIGYEYRPVNYVSWYNSARFCNWLSTGDTETGCYDTTEWSFDPNNGNYWIPTENEWYKAAYYSGSGSSYYVYATQSDDIPEQALADEDGNVSNPGTNVANYGSGFNWPLGVSENISMVGDCGSSSHYGTFDQSGNVAEWINDWHSLQPVSRGGTWYNSQDSMRSDAHVLTSGYHGFRIATSDSNATRLFFDPCCFGEINIIPTIYCYNYFTDGNNVTETGSTSTGSSYEPAYVLPVNLYPDRDRDDDGLYNDDEVNIYGTDPDNADTDGDGMPDGWEVEGELNPLFDDAEEDADSDTVINIEECNLDTDPNDINEPLFIYVDCNNTSGIEDGSTIYPYNTIQEAIDCCDLPALIKVSPGTYYEVITFKDKIILEGFDPAITIIDANDEGCVVDAEYISWGRISGFTITSGNGSGILCDNSCMIIAGNVIKNNHNNSIGAGICCFGSYNFHPPIIYENLICNNSTSKYGGVGGIYVSYSQILIINNIIAHNSGDYWGSGAIKAGDSGFPLIINNTIVDNRDNKGGGTISCQDQTGLVSNCILWGNMGGLSGCSVTYSDIEYGWPGIGNINIDPYFVRPGYMDDNDTPADANDDFWVDGDYRLLSESSCIDSGDPNYVCIQNETDIDGHPRIIDGDCNETDIVDMGAYEFSWLYVGDFAGGCDVDFKDFAVLALNWLTDEYLIDIAPSPIGDGVVDVRDLAIFCNNWLAGTEP